LPSQAHPVPVRLKAGGLALRSWGAYHTCHVVPLDTAIALEAAAVCRRHKLPTTDAIIYATAIHQSADLLTCDHHFAGPNVTVIEKAG
jgi:predicted nucleic acid-binding protein